MKIAFLHGGENELTTRMFHALQERLAPSQVVSWNAEEAAPANDFHILLSSASVDRRTMDALPNLVLIQTTSTGYETVDIDAASERGIWVSYAPSDLTGNATSVAEFAILLLLGASRQLNRVIESVHIGQVELPHLHPVLNGKTICIVGLGSIGRQVVDRLRPFGMLLLATDEHPENAPEGVTAFAPDKLPVAVADADYVLLCVRASRENEGLMSKSVIRAMKRGAILINVARGSLIDEQALLAAIMDGHISAVGLDVVREEPLQPANPLLKLPQALITPHIAAFTDLMLTGTVDFISQVVTEFEAGSRLASALNDPATPRRPLK